MEMRENGDYWILDEDNGTVERIEGITGDFIFINDVLINEYRFDTQKKIDALVEIATHYFKASRFSIDLYNNKISIIAYDNYRIVRSSNWDLTKRPGEFEAEIPIMLAYSMRQFNTSSNRIVLTVFNGRISSRFENKWDMINGFVHERLHLFQSLDKYDYKKHEMYFELEAYKAQMKHFTWERCSSGYKSFILGNAVDIYMPMLYKGVDKPEIKALYDQYLDFFNQKK